MPLVHFLLESLHDEDSSLVGGMLQEDFFELRQQLLVNESAEDTGIDDVVHVSLLTQMVQSRVILLADSTC